MTEPAQLDRKGTGMKQGAKEGGKGDTLKVIVQALLIALVVRTFLFQPFNIPSGSMIPPSPGRSMLRCWNRRMAPTT